MRRHWKVENGHVLLFKLGEPVQVSVERLDRIAAGFEAADFYQEVCAAWDIDLVQEMRNPPRRQGKMSYAPSRRRAGAKRSVQRAAAEPQQLGLQPA